MRITIPERVDAPQTNLFVEQLTLNSKLIGPRQTFILVPGGPGGNHTVFNSIKDELLNFCDLILFDPRGCGLSDSSETKFCTLKHYINDIEAIRNYFNLNKVGILGGSYGAIASLGFTLKYSAHVEKLILIAGCPSYRYIETAKKNLNTRGTPEQIKAAEDLWNGSFKDAEHFKQYYQIMKSLYLFNPPSNATLPTTKPGIPYNISITNLGAKDFLTKFDFEDNLKNISCETLILSGKNDWINDPSNATLMADNIPNSTLHIFENCGHFIWEDQREKFFDAVKKFLE